MMKMKKMLILGLGIVMIISMFAGCGSENSNQGKKFVVLEENLLAEEYGVGFRNTDVALGLEVQRLLDEMVADGTYLEISEKWFEEDTIIKDAEYIEETQAAADDKSLQNVLDKGTLIMGLDDSFPPMGFRDENNEISGFDIDLAKEVASRMGVKLVTQPIEWSAKEMELSTGKIDCIWNGMTITDERIANMYFAKPYIANRQIIIVPEGSEITDKAGMEGKLIGLQKGSSSLDALTADPISKKVGEVTQYVNNVDVFNDLKAGRIEVMIADEVVAKYIIAKDTENK